MWKGTAVMWICTLNTHLETKGHYERRRQEEMDTHSASSWLYVYLADGQVWMVFTLYLTFAL